MKLTRKKRRLNRLKLERQNEAMSRIVGIMFAQAIDGKTCDVCGEKASGFGDGVSYCSRHFFEEFEKRHGSK